jgi:hypothetical protein
VNFRARINCLSREMFLGGLFENLVDAFSVTEFAQVFPTCLDYQEGIVLPEGFAFDETSLHARGWTDNHPRNESCKMTGIRVRWQVSFNYLFDILEVAAHSVLEVLLGVTYVDTTRRHTRDLVD